MSEREIERMVRKKVIALEQARQFEDELSGYELNVARLDGIPNVQRGEEWQEQKDAAETAMSTIRDAIVVTLAEAVVAYPDESVVAGATYEAGAFTKPEAA